MKSFLQISSYNKPHRLVIISVIVIIALFSSISLLSSKPQTEPDLNVKVTDFYPVGETGIASNITIEFSRDMVEEDSLDRVVLDPPLTIKPELPGVGRWIDQNTFRYYPDHNLLPATEYQIRVKSNSKYLYGNRIKEDREFYFHTPPLKITRFQYYSLDDPEYPGHVRLNIDLTFNYPVDTSELRKKLSIKGERYALISDLEYKITAVYSTLDHFEDIPGQGNYILVSSEPIPTSDKRQDYILKIKKNLPCYTCGEDLLQEYEKRMTLQPRERLIVRNLSSTIRGTQGSIIINFSKRITTDNPDEYISVEPQVKFSTQSSYNRIYLRGNFLPGNTYEVNVQNGLPSIDGSVLSRDFSSKVTIDDIPPTVYFTSEGKYLPKEGAGLIEFETINMDSILVEVEQYFVNNIIHGLNTSRTSRYHYYSSGLEFIGRKFFDKSMKLQGKLNKPLRTTVDIGEIIGDTMQGVFRVSVRNKNRRWDNDSRLLILTDIGVLARMSDNYLMVWANSLSESKPVKKAKVTLLSKNNQVLLEEKTDSRGIAVFNDIKESINGFDPYLIVVSKDEDLSYLKFDECLLPTSDFNVSGRKYLVDGYSAYLYTDRGIYRPGETAHIASLVRGNESSLPPEFPYFVRIIDPAGNRFKSYRLNTHGTGFTTIDFDIPNYAQTGTYTIVAEIGDDLNIGISSFQVEEFMPDRIKVKIESDCEEYTPGDSVNIKVSGKFLFGTPAEGHKVSGNLILEKHDFNPAGFSNYSFSNRGRGFSKIDEKLADAVLDDSGFCSYDYIIPANLTPPSALKGLIYASVSEEGGRAVSGYNEISIHPYKRYLGIAKNFEGYADLNKLCEFNIAAVDVSGKKISVDSVWVKYYQVIYQSILQKDNQGRYRYVSESNDEIIDSVRVNVSIDGVSVSFNPPDYGHYKAVVDDDKGGHQASVSFYVSGWGYAPWSMENPDRIEIDLDKKEYTHKDKARIQIRAPFGGKLLVTVEREKVLDFIVYEMEENTSKISLPIKKDYFPNVYVTATIIKNAEEVKKHSPARAFGVTPITLSKDEKKLKISMDAPDVIKPNTELDLNFKVNYPGITELTVAAVDEGILQLNEYANPDPLDFFYGQRQLHLKPYDIYSYIYPEIEKAESHLSPAGDRMYEHARIRHLMPGQAAMRVKPVALWSDIIKTDENGYAKVSFNVPEYNGQLRVMAVAVHEDKYGSVQDEIIVRDKIIIQESFPRFISPNDIFEGFITLFNYTGSDAEISVSLDIEGPLEMLSSPEIRVQLDDKQEGSAVFRLKATNKPGVIKVKIKAETGKFESEKNFELTNRPAVPIVTKSGSGSVTTNNPTQFSVPDNWLETTSRYIFQTSSISAVKFTKNINYLVSYPYGCLEQTTSRLFPLLYYNELAQFADPEQIGSGGIDYYINEGILKIKNMMRPEGGFFMWHNVNRFNIWASLYASHFLIEAKHQGFFIESYIYTNIIEHLKDVAEGMADSEDPDRIYASYILALDGNLRQKSVNYLKNIHVESLPSFSKYLLAGALGLAGENEFAMNILPRDVQPEYYEPETGGRFSSSVRDYAIHLDILTQLDPSNPSCAVLAKYLIDEASIGRWYTTQENAYALMALGKYFQAAEPADFTGKIDFAGDSAYTFSTDDFKVVKNDIGDNQIDISIDGEGTCFYYWQASGIPADGFSEEFSKGIDIRRIYMDENGYRLSSDSLPLGSQIICKITAKAKDRPLNNVVINDLLPAGFEIENPRLKTSPRFDWLPKIKGSIDFQDIRDDRLLLFVNISPDSELEYYYSLRAISAGDFKIPPVAAECMYNPVISASGSSGRIIIYNPESELKNYEN